MTQQGTYDKCRTCAYLNAPEDNLACVGCYAGRNYKPKEYRPKVNYSDARMVGGRRRIIFNPKYYLDAIIKKVIFNPPATIVLWADGFPKTVVKCQPGDTYDREKGLAMCIAKRMTGNRSSYCDVFKKWCGDNESIHNARRELRDKLLVKAAAQLQLLKDAGHIEIPVVNTGVETDNHAIMEYVIKLVDDYIDDPDKHGVVFLDYIDICFIRDLGVKKGEN